MLIPSVPGPNIQGLHDFNGVLAHSANWDPSIDWTEKNVAVIGTGSSSIQMVPEFARGARSVTVFMRNSSWISDPFAIEVAGKQENQDLSSAKARHTYSEEEKESFRNDPESHLEYRKRLESAVVSTFPMFYRGSELNKKAKDTMRARMLERIGDGFEELKRRLIPDWSPGCRRLTVSRLTELIHTRTVADPGAPTFSLVKATSKRSQSPVRAPAFGVHVCES
jgi:cation diffusion facilitator CzcD-associated flavoprotein CzcO